MKRRNAISLSMLDLITNALGMFLVQMFVVSTFKPPIHRERVQGVIVVEGILDDPKAGAEVQLVLHRDGVRVETLDSGEIRSGSKQLVGEWPATARAKRELLESIPLAMVYENPSVTGDKVAVLRNPRVGDLEMKVLYSDQPDYQSSNQPASEHGLLRTYVALERQNPIRTRQSGVLRGTGDGISHRAKVVVAR